MKLGDQPVHPTPWEDDTKPNGITLRQEFAKAALNYAGWAWGPNPDIHTAHEALNIADALIAELEKTRSEIAVIILCAVVMIVILWAID